MKVNSPTKMTYPGPPRRASGLLRYLILAVAIVSVLYYLRDASLSEAFNSAHDPVKATPSAQSPQDAVKPGLQSTTGPIIPQETKPAAGPIIPQETTPTVGPVIPQETEQTAPPKSKTHPIDELIETAEKDYQSLLGKESHDLKAAAAEYRKRRGRHPPPGFDTWFKFAQDNKAVMVEDFFDQIYHDIGPFWGLAPSTMRREASAYEMVIKIRNHNATAGSDWFWTKIWLNLVKTIVQHLPDMDIALNAMDEPRVLLPWEEINGYMEKERASRFMAPAQEVISKFQTLDPKPDPEEKVRPLNLEKDSKSAEVSV
jgi:hypothetical protein